MDRNGKCRQQKRRQEGEGGVGGEEQDRKGNRIPNLAKGEKAVCKRKEWGEGRGGVQRDAMHCRSCFRTIKTVQSPWRKIREGRDAMSKRGGWSLRNG